MRNGFSAWVTLLPAAFPFLQGTAPPPPLAEYAAPSALPVDQVTDTYTIYAQLLPSGVVEWSNVKRSQWLIEDVTSAQPLASACTDGGLMNPHQSIRPPAPRTSEFAEVLADFDARCHVRYQLEGSRFHLSLPVRLMDEGDRHRFTQGVAGFMPPANDIMRAPATPADFKGAAGMHRFTAVYFNRSRTLAMTQVGMYCGSLCGQWSWVVLERTTAGWRTLPWVYTTMMS